MILNENPTIHNIHEEHVDDVLSPKDILIDSKMNVAAGIHNENNESNSIIEAIKTIHNEHLSKLEDAVFFIDDILLKNS